MACHRPRRGELRSLQPCILDELDFECDRHRTLECRASQLTVTLGSMGVADRQESAGDLDRQIKDGSCRKVADIEIAAGPVWRQSRVQSRLSLGKTDDAGE